MKKILSSVLILASTFVAVSATAAPIYFTSRADFQAAAGALSTESFEVNQSGGTHTYSDFQFSETGGTNAVVNYLGNNCCVNPVTDGNGAIWFDDNGASIGTFFNFINPIYAFGVDITSNQTQTLSIGGGAINDTLALAANQSSFWGVIDTSALASITFDMSGGPNYGFDYVQYSFEATQTDGDVPAPASVALLGLGLMGLGWVRRKAAK